jgi:hypothetical protein
MATLGEEAPGRSVFCGEFAPNGRIDHLRVGQSEGQAPWRDYWLGSYSGSNTRASEASVSRVKQRSNRATNYWWLARWRAAYVDSDTAETHTSSAARLTARGPQESRSGDRQARRGICDVAARLGRPQTVVLRYREAKA